MTAGRAEAFGYGEPPASGPSGEDLLREYLDSLGPQARAEWERAFFGSGEEVQVVTDRGEVYGASADGCLAEGEAEVAGDVETSLRWSAVVNEILGLRIEAQERAMADDRVGAVVDEWSVCMREAGYDFERPVDAMGAGLASRDGTGALVPASEEPQGAAAVSEEERHLAVADARCRGSVGYQEVLDDVTSYYENVVLVENEAVVLAWREIVAEMEDAAARFDGPAGG